MFGLFSGNSIVIFAECFKDHLLLEIKVASFIFSAKAVLIEKIFLGLRARNQFDLDTLFKNEEQRNAIDNLYEKWKKLGYLRASSKRNGIDLSPLGYLMCDSLIDDIFKYVKF